MNKKLTDYVIDLVEILNKQQKQVFWGIFDILSMVVSIIVSYILFYGLINPAPVTKIVVPVSSAPRRASSRRIS